MIVDSDLSIDYSSVRFFFRTFIIAVTVRSTGTGVRIDTKDLILNTLILLFGFSVVGIKLENIEGVLNLQIII